MIFNNHMYKTENYQIVWKEFYQMNNKMKQIFKNSYYIYKIILKSCLNPRKNQEQSSYDSQINHKFQFEFSVLSNQKDLQFTVEIELRARQGVIIMSWNFAAGSHF
ncbi:hypothetical protein pb186bvf_001252 [Paramecium bursaria]